MKSWTLESIDWTRFDASKVDPETTKIVKAAALVEHNGWEYAAYLKSVFAGDAEFAAAADEWAEEEVRHGEALARWAKLADPCFDFKAAFKDFTEGYKLPLEARESVRGSRTGELIARCIVETGTSSYYTAIKDATDEPVLQKICAFIAADELRHYKLFYSHMKRYLAAEGIGRWERLKIAAGRITETEDDELAYAYFAANRGEFGRYDRKQASNAYARRAYAYYRPQHVDRGAAMILKAVGLEPRGRLHSVATKALWWFIDTRTRYLNRKPERKAA